MSDLPSTNKVGLDHEGQSVWPWILEAEEAAKRDAPRTPCPKYNDKLIGVRVLGFLLQDMWQHQRHSFGLIPYKTLINQITPCLSIAGVVFGSKEEAEERHAKLQNLGLYCRNHLMRVCASRNFFPGCDLLEYIRGTRTICLEASVSERLDVI